MQSFVNEGVSLEQTVSSASTLTKIGSERSSNNNNCRALLQTALPRGGHQNVVVAGHCFSLSAKVWESLRKLPWQLDQKQQLTLQTTTAIFEVFLHYLLYNSFPAAKALHAIKKTKYVSAADAGFNHDEQSTKKRRVISGNYNENANAHVGNAGQAVATMPQRLLRRPRRYSGGGGRRRMQDGHYQNTTTALLGHRDACTNDHVLL